MTDNQDIDPRPVVDVRLVRLGQAYDVVVCYPGKPARTIRVNSRSLYDVTDAAVDAIEEVRSHEQVMVTWTLEGARDKPEPILIDRVGKTPLPSNLPLWGRN
ncbi:hypothetical protein [Nocardioides speluncae]|uniref:hypothetical protein n=1 Tax=Nocardioides speluncae TaxID=2670337 RepID=UPI0012B18271|nr:hypothetical protein [Nocardioides speluncae]